MAKKPVKKPKPKKPRKPRKPAKRRYNKEGIDQYGVPRDGGWAL